MSLFGRRSQPGLCSFRITALLKHLLELLSEVQLLGLRQLVTVEVPGHVDAEVSGRYPLELDQLAERYLLEASDPGLKVNDRPGSLHEVHRSQ